MEILHFMYRKKLSSRTMKSSSALLAVMKLADKFQVDSCINQCVLSLLGLPMTRKSALLYLDMPVRKEYQSLIDRAKSFLVSHYNDLTKSCHVLCNMTVAGMEVILCSNEVWALSEDCIYDIVLNWAKKQYPKLKDRRAVLRSCITRLVRFPYLTCAKLRKALACKDLDYEFARDVVDEALFFKADPKTIIFHRVYLEQCKTLKSGERLCSLNFYWAKHLFSFYMVRSRHSPDSQYDSCGLFFQSMEKILSVIVVNCVCATKKKPEMDFQEFDRTKAILKEDGNWGYSNPFLMPWETFIADDSPYFIDGVFHFRAEISIQPET
ncbi:BTB/POZ domain-containing protein POB1 [Acorus gramineus]|uniref:BTB/POZ domain-containing protein POB1 n=1 Tax=Acorus gramineus TaxID=55184 RepID=A0AAV9ALV9_ACOGR|nr:BTB/POZ domain-containing protein POB1 [Acorus gramineus]